MNATLPPLNIARLVQDTDRLVHASRASRVDVDRLLLDTERLLAGAPAPQALGVTAVVVITARSQVALQ